MSLYKIQASVYGLTSPTGTIDGSYGQKCLEALMGIARG